MNFKLKRLEAMNEAIVYIEKKHQRVTSKSIATYISTKYPDIKISYFIIQKDEILKKRLKEYNSQHNKFNKCLELAKNLGISLCGCYIISIISTVRPNRGAIAIVPKELDNQIC